MTFIKNYNKELYHYGVKGMKWGVRRSDKRGNRDAVKLSKTFEKHLDSYNDSVRSKKKVYLVDEKGANRYRSDGTGYFDTSGGMTITNIKKDQKVRDTNKEYEALKRIMSKKYDDVVSKANYDYQTGKATINVILKKQGKTYVSEITKDYGEYKDQIEFITYKKE